MIGAPRSMIRVVQGDGHPVHGNDFERLALKLKVEIAIRGSIHKTPKLALTRGDFNLRPQRAVQSEDLFWGLWLRTAHTRTEFNPMLQIGSLRIIHKGAAAHNQHTLRQAS